MPAPLDSDAPNVDARYVQNLTINITYHTSAVPTYSAPMPQLHLYQAPAPDAFDSRRPVASSVCFPSVEEVAAAYALAFAVAQALKFQEKFRLYSAQ